MTQTELAQIVGGGKQSISDWERDATGPTRKKLPLLAAALGVDVDALLSESGTATTSKKKLHSVRSNVKGTTKIKTDAPGEAGAGGLLPLITWEQALVWGSKLETTTAETEMLPCEVDHSTSAFYMEVVGDSMESTTGPVSFREGDQIAVDPKRKPIHRNFVLAAINEETVLLRQLIVEDGKRFLKAINPDWPAPLSVLQDEDRIIGTVIKLTPKTKVLV